MHGNLHLAELPTCPNLGGETSSEKMAARANFDAQMPVRLFPRLARRARAVSAALGRFHAPLPRRCLRYGHSGRSTALPAANAIQTANFDQSMQSALPGVPSHHHDPPPTDSASLAYSQRTRAHVRQRLRGLAGRWCGRRCRYGVRYVLRDRTAACRACFTVIYSRTTQQHSRFSRQLKLQSSDTPICGAAECAV